MLVLYSILTLSQFAFSIYPSSPRRPDDPQPAHAPLRLGTFNLGLGLTHKLPRIVARCAELELDIIALQEVGDPALLCNRFPPYQLIYAAGPSHHQAGVGLLLLSRLAPSVRRYLRSPSGRLAGAVLELTHGHQLLLVSAYMPSGIDHQPPSSEAHHTARSLYAELLGWTAGMQQVIVLGDLNETLTRWDRHPLPAPRLIGGVAAVAADSPLHTLVAEGYTDVYRHLHPLLQHHRGSHISLTVHGPHAVASTTSGARALLQHPSSTALWMRHCILSPITVCCGRSCGCSMLLQRHATHHSINSNYRTSEQQQKNTKQHLCSVLRAASQRDAMSSTV